MPKKMKEWLRTMNWKKNWGWRGLVRPRLDQSSVPYQFLIWHHFDIPKSDASLLFLCSSMGYCGKTEGKMACNAMSELPPCQIRVLLEKLIVAQVVKKFIPFIGSKVYYLFHKRLPLVLLREMSQVQFIYPIYLGSILVLSFNQFLYLPNGLFRSDYRTLILY
jgi:hypothetical protein